MKQPVGPKGGDFVGIGSLEARVLRALYSFDGWSGVQQVWCYAQDEKPVERGAVLTCLKRMAAKGFVEGRKDAAGVWEFKPAIPAQELAAGIFAETWRWLMDRPPPELSRFLGDALFGKLNHSQLEELRTVAAARFGSEGTSDVEPGEV
jgi:predicted transcriptional regulator